MFEVPVFLTRRGWCAAALLIFPLLVLTACGGGGGGGSSPGSGISTATNVTGQALLGPLSGADVEIFDLSSGERVFASQTASSIDLAEAGTFSVPVTALADQKLYLVRVSGGLDIDADDDGVLDPVATVNNGEVRLVLTGQRIKQGDFRVSLLSELVYRRLVHLLQTDVDPDDFLAEVERRVATILQSDIDGDGDLDSDDMAAWHPQFNGADVRNGLTAYQAVISGIHDNDTTASASLLAADLLLGAAASGRAPSMAVQGDIAYLADGPFGLNIVDISQADAPRLWASLDTPGLALGVAVDGNIAYVADAGAGLQVVSVGDPVSPALLGGLPTGGETRGVVVVNGVVYVIDSADGLLILDTSNPAQPRVAGALAVEGDPLGISTDPQYPNRLLAPVRQSDGKEVDLVFLVEASGVILEGTLGPDPDNPELEKILVTNPADTPDGGFTQDPGGTINQDPANSGDGVIQEGTLGPDPGNEPLDSEVVSNPDSGGSDGFQVEEGPSLLQ